MKATWLFDKHPIVIDTTLAQVVGLNEAIVLQQLNYWLHSKSAKYIDGRLWVYNTFENWRKDNFPFWSLKTIKRVFGKLEKEGLIITANYNKAGFDKTKWYSIATDKLDLLMSLREGQSDPTMGSKCPDGSGQNDPTYTRDYTKNTTENNYNSPAEPNQTSQTRKSIIDYLNQKLGTKYKPNASKNKTVINARLNEGYTLDDFKQVIDNKYNDWANDAKMVKYLRPETLFGTKFEGYLNEQSTNPYQPQKRIYD